MKMHSGILEYLELQSAGSGSSGWLIEAERWSSKNPKWAPVEQFTGMWSVIF